MTDSNTARASLVAALWVSVFGAIAVALVRLAPHPANFTPIGALGLFMGARFRGGRAIAAVLLVMFGTDLALWAATQDANYFFHVSRFYVYPSLILYVLIGKGLTSASWLGLAGGALAGSLQFFLVTNFFDWLCQPLQPAEYLVPEFTYTRDLAGLLHCYAAALPFFQTDTIFHLHSFLIVGHPAFGFYGTVLGDLVFTFALFGAYAIVLDVMTKVQPVQPELEPVRSER